MEFKTSFILLMLASMASLAPVFSTKTTLKQKLSPGRKLSSFDFLEESLAANWNTISIQHIRDQIIDMHKNVKLCIDTEFDKPPSDILLFEDIMLLCVGHNYAIVTRFYESIAADIRQITLESIKNSLSDGYCDAILFQCLTFFRMIEIFISKDYDVKKSFDLNEKEISRQIDALVLNNLLSVTESHLSDYNSIRSELMDERRFLTDYFKQQYSTYVNTYGIPNNTTKSANLEEFP